MDQRELITDIVYEIFRYFVAVDPDGPFTLMLVCSAWQEVVLNYPPLWSWIHMDADVGDLEARMAIGIALSAHQPLHLHLYMPYPPSFIEFIRPHTHRIHSVVVHMPMDVGIDEATGHVSKMIRDLHLGHRSFRFRRGEEDVFYSPDNPDKILEKYSLNQRFDSPICPSNMITALTFSDPYYREDWETRFSLHTFLTWLSLNVHLVDLDIQSDRLTIDTKIALPMVSLHSLTTLTIQVKEKFSSEVVEAILLRHIRSPNPIAITLRGDCNSLVAAICEMGAGLRPSAMTLCVGRRSSSPLDEKLERIKKALSSVQHLHIRPLVLPMESFQTNQLVECLPRSAVLRIASSAGDDQLVSLIDHPPHLIQLEYWLYNTSGRQPSIPTWCRNTTLFDSLLLKDCDISSMASFCKKLALVRVYTSQKFIHSQTSLDIEELQCDSDVHVEINSFPPKAGELDNLSKLTCTLSFAVVLLQQRRLPMLRELILLNGTANIRPVYTPFSSQWELLGSLLTKTSHTRAPMRLLSTPVWMPWVPLFKIAKLLSEGNQSQITPTLVLPSLPHPHILSPLVDSLNGKPVTQMAYLPSWKSKKHCDFEGICYECHNSGWWCTNIKRCRRGQRGSPASITRYTLLNR